MRIRYKATCPECGRKNERDYKGRKLPKTTICDFCGALSSDPDDWTRFNLDWGENANEY